MKEHSVFVYGTLKRGERNHRVLSSRNAVCMGRVKTIDFHFVMVQFNSKSTPGHYSPGVFTGPLDTLPQGHVLGEIFQVDADTLAALDKLENVGVNYDRVMVTLEGERKAWMYIKRRDGRVYEAHSPFIVYKDRSYEWSQGFRI